MNGDGLATDRGAEVLCGVVNLPHKPAMRAAWQIRQRQLASVTTRTLNTASIPSKAGVARRLGAWSCRGIGKHRRLGRCTGRRGHPVARCFGASQPSIYAARIPESTPTMI